MEPLETVLRATPVRDPHKFDEKYKGKERAGAHLEMEIPGSREDGVTF